MLKCWIKRALCTALCSVLLTGAALGASAAELTGGQKETPNSFSRSTLSDLIEVTQYTQFHGGQRKSSFSFTAPEDSIFTGINYSKNNWYSSTVPSSSITGNTAYLYDEGLVSDIFIFEFYLTFTDGNRVRITKTVYPQMTFPD